MLMSYNIVTDPDDLLRKIPPNVIRDMERVVRRIEGLLPSIYMGLEKALEKARPGSLWHFIYPQESGAVEEILKFLDDPGDSYLIGVPFQPLLFADDYVYRVAYMAVPRSRIEVLGPAKCTVLVFPSAVMLPDNILRSALAHELVHCTIRDPNERVTYGLEEMLTELVPDLFLAIHMRPPHMVIAIAEYMKQNRVPVISYKIIDVVVNRIATDPVYARQILDKSVIVQLKPSASWKKKS